MYNQKKASVDITPTEPQFVAQYVGKTEVYVSIGKGCTRNAVQTIWDNGYDDRRMKRVSVLINCGGIVMKELDSSSRSTGTSTSAAKNATTTTKTTTLDIMDIAYCCADNGIHERVFAWISRRQDQRGKKAPSGGGSHGNNAPGSRLECHAVLCPTRESAQLMALTLHTAFHVAYKDWKRKKQLKENTKMKPITGGGGIPTQGPIVVSGSVHHHHNHQDAGSLSGVSDTSGSSEDPDQMDHMETIMAQMNIIEEEELSVMDNSIVIK